MQINITDLTVEYQSSLLGTDILTPRFSWRIKADRRGVVQQAYQIQVSIEKDDFSSVYWDSGKVLSNESIQVEYSGPPVSSRTRYYFRVKVWDGLGIESNWSETTYWETGLLNADEWQAEWITPHPDDIDSLSPEAFMLRKEFTLGSNITSARIYATAAGLYELHLNGERVGNEFLTPGWTSYQHRLQYQTYDVTDAVQSGKNAVGIILGDGWFKGELLLGRHQYGDFRSALLQLHVKYEDGSELLIGTDSTWKATIGPILFSELYDGEIYDARKEIKGWDQAGLEDSNWARTIPHSWRPERLVAQENWPCRVVETIHPIEVIQTPAGDRVLDMGQNMVGRMKFIVDIPQGSAITLKHAEVLDKDGNFYTGNLNPAKQQIEFISNGKGNVTYFPHFTFQGFRYVKIEGLPNYSDEALMDAFVGEVIHSDMKQTGFFECSDRRVNQLQKNIVWGQRGNFVDVPTDCPQRAERLGWTGDAQVFIGTALFNYHVGPFFTKWLRDVSAEQLPDGSIPVVVPDVLSIYSSSGWGDVITIVPWNMYQAYADKRILTEQYDSMKKWVDYIRYQGENEYLWNTGFHLGDWLALDAKEDSYEGATPKDLIATAFFAHSVRIVRDTARVIGKMDDAKFYDEVLHNIIKEFHSEFVSPSGRLAAHTQTAYVLALVFDLVEGPVRERAAKELNHMIVVNDYHLSTGFIGTPYLCFALSANGYHDTAVKLLLQESYPSWLYSVSKGATTIWEHWDSIKPDGSFWSEDMNSFNHYAYGAIGEWLYRVVAGLDQVKGVSGYKKIHIRPQIGHGELTYAKASLISPYGEIVSSWRMSGNKVELEVHIPPNTSGTITLPHSDSSTIFESGKRLELVEGIESFTIKDNHAEIIVGSGVYRFSCAYQCAPKLITEETLLSELYENPDAMKVIEQYFPEFTIFLIKSMSIGEAARLPGSPLTEDSLQLMLDRLNKSKSLV
ncbi:alpha-L-rhamnosidase [Domibacillus robiginosus]|uniref:alpha-L-rhamnosidase n=1 Tax=Domibacillus robiginosus TaxID=1071054 RepID=UPI00067DECEF|nr:alpha-L-rhamnosidase [Domibacillus robiginosus]